MRNTDEHEANRKMILLKNKNKVTRRYPNMNHLGPALLEALSPLNPQIDTKNLSSNDPMAYAYCCTRCRKEIRRLEIKLLGKTIRPLPVCKCVSEDAERRRQERELANKRDYIRRVYGEGLIDDDLKRSSFDNFIPGKVPKKLIRWQRTLL